MVVMICLSPVTLCLVYNDTTGHYSITLSHLRYSLREETILTARFSAKNILILLSVF